MTEKNAVERQKKIVEILQMLHQGGDFEAAKQIFDETFDGVDVAEITGAERELIASGLNPMEIQTLCNVHAAVFRGKITNQKTPMAEIPGHPVQVMKLENVVLESLINDELLPTLKKWIQQASAGAKTDPTEDAILLQRLQNALADLGKIDAHYKRKENLIFPLMTKYGITAPPKVMWGVDDEIREWIKAAQRAVTPPVSDRYQAETAIEKVAKEVDEMVFKEEEIMLPMVLEVFTPSDWGMIQAESGPIGYTLIPDPLPWQPTAEERQQKPKPSKLAQELNAQAEALATSQQLGSQRPAQPTDRDILSQIHQDVPMPVAPPEVMAKLQAGQGEASESTGPRISVQKPRHRGPVAFGAATSDSSDGRVEIDGTHPARVVLPTGSFDLDQLTNVLRLLPVDLTFVDATDTVRWFSDNGHRVFPRTTAVIGRLVVDCHPPKSVDKVKAILADFHSGKADHADFWIHFRDRMLYIRYFAIHNPAGDYLGCLEVNQDVTDIRALEGEKRL
ncbi:MAG: DUF438 domain-containing protein [Lactobacillus sp.]|jgi:DUF438 domain-containing protein|uniref:DUF438 domain-containing protein n=1 Tax=Lacticaseibacillus suilingensis TaxID=2799577 RepID=A0ABW4BHW1_9LACO|nr:DUF438 domain-containing protein [Lacticaseibacillus suilingensis]MCI1893902.1 DUF438 domain-containing protein [Lactobacillus sp.]MCI1918057.1 DUF438 domain-containing protein [Lactobacillus sp.]MCI1941938.1 DUF438 domain-containing protein [Lactobacillus sp.]MCI1972923.1 DUF438 domain-containing protein [Lactobacillus sp.]